MNTKDIRYVRYIVSRYLRGKPELKDFRDDLESEGCLAFLEARDAFDPEKSSMDFELYVFYRVKQTIQNYVNRSEAKHFRRPPADHGSPYWDLNEGVVLEELPDDDEPTDAEILKAILDICELSPKQREAVDTYIYYGTLEEAASVLGVSHQAISQRIALVIREAKDNLAKMGL